MNCSAGAAYFVQGHGLVFVPIVTLMNPFNGQPDTSSDVVAVLDHGNPPVGFKTERLRWFKRNRFVREATPADVEEEQASTENPCNTPGCWCLYMRNRR